MKYLLFGLLVASVLFITSHQTEPVYGYPYKTVTHDHSGYYYDRQTYCKNVTSGDMWVENSLGLYNSQIGYAPYPDCIN